MPGLRTSGGIGSERRFRSRIEDGDPAGAGDQDVRGLQVTMEHARFMKMMQTSCDLLQDTQQSGEVAGWPLALDRNGRIGRRILGASRVRVVSVRRILRLGGRW